MPSRMSPAGVALPPLSPAPPGRGARLTGATSRERRGCGLPLPPPPLAAGGGGATAPATPRSTPVTMRGEPGARRSPPPSPAARPLRRRDSEIPAAAAPGTGKAAAPRPVGDAVGDAMDDARRRAMTGAGDGAGAVRLLSRHHQPGGRAVPSAPPPGRGVRGGAGARGELGRGVRGYRGGDARARRGMLGHGGGGALA